MNSCKTNIAIIIHNLTSMVLVLAIYMVFIIIQRQKYRISLWIGLPVITIVYSICALHIDNIFNLASNASESAGAAVGIIIVVYLGIEFGLVLWFLSFDVVINVISRLRSSEKKNIYYFLNIAWAISLVGIICILTNVMFELAPLLVAPLMK